MIEQESKDPVTTIICRVVKKDKIDAFEAWLKEMTVVRSKFYIYPSIDGARLRSSFF